MQVDRVQRVEWNWTGRRIDAVLLWVFYVQVTKSGIYFLRGVVEKQKAGEVIMFFILAYVPRMFTGSVTHEGVI